MATQGYQSAAYPPNPFAPSSQSATNQQGGFGQATDQMGSFGSPQGQQGGFGQVGFASDTIHQGGFGPYQDQEFARPAVGDWGAPQTQTFMEWGGKPVQSMQGGNVNDFQSRLYRGGPQPPQQFGNTGYAGRTMDSGYAGPFGNVGYGGRSGMTENPSAPYGPSGSYTPVTVPPAQGPPTVGQQPGQFPYDPNDPSSAVGYFTDPNTDPYRLDPNQAWAINNIVGWNQNNMPPDPLSNSGFTNLGRSMGRMDSILDQPGPRSIRDGVADVGAAAPWQDRAGGYGPEQASYTSAAGPNGPAQAAYTRAAGPNGPTQAYASAAGTNYRAPSINTGRIDSSQAIAAAKRQLGILGSPSIRASLQASGMGRSGAEAEALARAGVGLELPIAQQVMGADQSANELDARMRAEGEGQAQRLNAQSDMFNAGQSSETSRFNAGQGNTMSMFDAGQGNAMSMFNAGQGNAMSMFDAGQANDMSRFNVQAGLGRRQQDIGIRDQDIGIRGQDIGIRGQNLGANQFDVTAGLNRRGQDIGAIGDQNRINSQMALAIPGLQANQFNMGNQAWNNILGAVSLPGQMRQAGYNNLQNFGLSLMGATPIPGGSIQTGQTSQNPNYVQSAGNLALLGGILGNSGMFS